VQLDVVRRRSAAAPRVPCAVHGAPRARGARPHEHCQRRYQDAVCALRLTGARNTYEDHCRGDVCEHFAPAALMTIHRPLPRAKTAATTPPPLVSCIMPTRDRADFALHAIELLQRQDHTHWELVIVDDGDGLQERLPDDPRIRYVRAPAGESVGAKRNRAVEAARGELVVHWDDDDWYAPQRLRRQLAPLLAGEADITALRAGTFLELGTGACWEVTPELAANASPKRTDNAWWSRMPLREVTRVLGDDARAYLPG
jgi:hypothetical protein